MCCSVVIVIIVVIIVAIVVIVIIIIIDCRPQNARTFEVALDVWTHRKFACIDYMVGTHLSL